LTLFGHEFVGSIDRDKLVEMLLEAFANEWVAGYYYMVTAYSIQGPGSDVVSKHFIEEAKEELGVHARLIADRLEELGVELPRDFSKLYELSSCKYPKLPSNPFNVGEWIKAAIDAEVCAIESYRRLYEFTHGRDPVSEELARKLLADEVRHRTLLANLLERGVFERLV